MARTSDSWTESQARDHVAGLASSGLSIEAYAQREGLSRRRLYYWVHRMRLDAERQPIERASVSFVEVAVSPSPPAIAGVLELEFPSGHVLRVPAALGLDELVRVVGLC